MPLFSTVLSSKLLAYSPLLVSILLAVGIVWLPPLFIRKLDISTVSESLMAKSRKMGEFLFSPMTASVYTWLQTLAILGVVGAFAVRLHAGGIPIFPLDDAYITMHNAQVLRTGHDPNYLGVPALIGATSSVHLVLAALMQTFLKPEWAQEVCSWLGVLVYATGLVKLGRANRASLTQTLLLLTAGLMAGKTTFQLFNGLETGLAMGAVAWALAFESETPLNSHIKKEIIKETDSETLNERGIRENRSNFNRPGKVEYPYSLAQIYHRFSLILLGTLPFIRPELWILTILLLAYRGFQRFRAIGTIPERVGNFAIDIAFVGAGAAPWLILAICNTGSPFPQTIAAKRAFFTSYWRPQFVFGAYMRFIAWNFYSQIGALFLGAFLLTLKNRGRVVFAFLTLFALAYLSTLPGSLNWNQYRYLYLLLPMALFGFAICFQNQTIFIRRIANALLLAGVFQAVCAYPANQQQLSVFCEFDRRELLGARDWCVKNLPPESVIVIHDAGAISCDTTFHLIDLVGLKTPESAEINKQIILPSNGTRRVEALETILRRSHATYLILQKNWNLVYKYTGGLKERGWKVEPLRGEQGDYQVYRVRE